MNDLVKILNGYRHIVGSVQSRVNMDKLGAAARHAVRVGSPFNHVMALPGTTNDIIVPSICNLVGDDDVLMPLIDSLNHLHLDEGWRLDGVLKGSHFASVVEFFVTDGKRCARPFDHLHLDGSRESVWEAHVFRMWGELFFRGWHAGYGDYRIVTGYDTLGAETKELIVPASSAMVELGSKSKILERWDFAPTVEVVGQTSKTTFTVFSSFGGFVKYQEIFRMRPFERVSLNKISELPYECQICY